MPAKASTITPQPYDFGVSSRLSRESLAGLRKIHNAAADDLEVMLSREFSAEIRVSGVDVSQVRYGKFMADTPPGSYHAILASATLGGQFQAALDPHSTALLMGLIFGAPMSEAGRDLSLVDARVLQTRFPLFVDALNRSFQPYFEIDLSFSKSVVSQKQVRVIDDEETVVIAELKFAVGTPKTDMVVMICYPQDVVTPVLLALSDLERATATEALIRGTPIQKSLMAVRLPVSVRLPSWVMSAEDIRNLEVGDIVHTGVPLSAHPSLVVAGRSLLDVRMFTNRQWVAAEVVSEHTG